jgi:predicted RNA-binding Zn-ribbon protein involved in translation (DUF1610 family)
MAASTGKTLGLILLIIIIIFFGLRITPLILAPFGVVTGAWHTLRIPAVDEFHFGPSFFRLTSLSLFSLVLLAVWIVVIVWVYRDAERRGMNGVLWALLVLIGNLIGLLIYLIVRSDNLPAPQERAAVQDCPVCQRQIHAGYSFCPHCGAKLVLSCHNCENPIEKNWKACPQCGEKLPED